MHPTDEIFDKQVYAGGTGGSGSFRRPLLIVKAFLMVEENSDLVEYKTDVHCLEKSAPRFVEMYAYQLLSCASNLIDEKYLIEEMHMYLEAVEWRRLTGALDSWGVPYVLQSFQNTQQHDLSYVWPAHKKYSFYSIDQHVTFTL